MSVDDLLAKAWQRFKIFLLVNNNLWGKLVSLSTIIFDDNVKTIADFSLLNCEFDSFTFKLLYCVIL